MPTRHDPASKMGFLEQAQLLEGKLVAWRRDFHKHPELGFHEQRTAGVVAEHLGQLGLKVKTGVAGTGVVAMLEGRQPGPCVLLRFDMDALPVQEETGVAYASTSPGVMHACGHDGHLAIGLGVASLLSARRERLTGSAKLVFQPAEEGLGGAQLMVQEGVLRDPVPDSALGLHLWNDCPVGCVAVASGAVMAAADILEIRIHGRGGHGALPQRAVDPIIAAAHLVVALQSIVSRNVDPLQAAVVSISGVKTGEAFNVIPSMVTLRGTIRTYTPELRTLVLNRVEELSRQVAQGFGCQAEVLVTMLTPVLYNDPALANRLQDLVRKVLPQAILLTDVRSMVSDDMAHMMQDIPGCYMLVGCNNPEGALQAAHHNPLFDFDEAALVLGTALMAAAACTLMETQ